MRTMILRAGRMCLATIGAGLVVAAQYPMFAKDAGEVLFLRSGSRAFALEVGLMTALAGWAVLMPLAAALATTLLTPVDPLKPLAISPFVPVISCFGPEPEPDSPPEIISTPTGKGASR